MEFSGLKQAKAKLPPRVLGDYGGRRRIFERRIDLSVFNPLERRSSKDRRSGFDRRSTLMASINETENRKGFHFNAVL
jgi:hypothetical protein